MGKVVVLKENQSINQSNFYSVNIPGVAREVNPQLSPNAKPFQRPPRAVFQSVMAQLKKKELDKMERESIIRPCPEPTKWVHDLVLVVKKDGSLCMRQGPGNLTSTW